ncbi:hypothetical protein B0H67DRAFT_592303 [Lasiosphaeris hirsuta]|uniref:Uncharacterized protein n=1 Tax=Lasiosphaeris hirsuta TaxID=260670 RepID=A0AA39ZW69_9PEZI|nr:hypothetical protein B0H67DRAFT_592303 [Lasiosphaeris hirsuta]
MPKQYVLFGRPVPRLGTRHTSLLLVTISLFALFSLFFMLPSAIPGPSLHDHVHKIPKSFKTPSWMSNLNPFKPPAHPPPRQQNDTDGEASWYSHWSGLNTAFSSDLTLDENRSLLPVIKPRPAIYCYYDNTIEKNLKDKDAEHDLLLSWRRAWWAQGFRPVILTPAEASSHPLFGDLQHHKEMNSELRTDLMRWLAWDNMNGGLLAHYHMFPMGSFDDPLLKNLRRNEFPKLTRWENLEDGLFAGAQPDITAAIKLVLAAPKIKDVKEVISAAATYKTDDPFTVDAHPESLAYYSKKQVESKYTKVNELIEASRASGLNSLNRLITSHLHLTWQNTFSDGIAVVKPMAHHTTHLITPAFQLASRLARCPDSPLPDSCPPNLATCNPCNSDEHPFPITTPSSYSNASTIYTIGTVPHPYTASSLSSMRENLDVTWVRRDSPRDAWLTDLTRDLLGSDVSGRPRVVRFKEAVASDFGAPRSLWLIAERLVPADLDWYFGFAVPPLPRGDHPAPPMHGPEQAAVPSNEERDQEPKLLTHATVVIGTIEELPASKRPKIRATQSELAVRDAAEAWNLADTEAWRFTRAYLARKTMERKKWEEDEAKYADGMGSEKGHRSPWDRWLDA